jgi:hypothetical protein
MNKKDPGMNGWRRGWMTLLVAAAAWPASWLLADNSASASIGARWLNLEGDPRVTALGGAYAGWAEGLPALGLNPGGLAQLRGIQASLGDQAWDQDVSVQRLAYGQALGGASALGVDAGYVNFGSIQQVDIVGGYPVEGSSLSPYAGSLSLTYARVVLEGLSAGVSAKVLTEALGTSASDAFAADFGILFAPQGQRWRLGASLLNLGSDLDSAPLPLQGRLGGSYCFSFSGSRQLLFVGDLLMTAQSDEIATGMAGLEYQAGGGASFRAGYRLGSANTSSGPSAGLGLVLGWLGLDYSYSLLSGLSSQELALTVRFGLPSAPPLGAAGSMP